MVWKKCLQVIGIRLLLAKLWLPWQYDQWIDWIIIIIIQGL